jgi:mRNA interferase MazF
MSYIGRVTRWEVYWVDLDPAVGREQAGARRPAVIVSNDGFNAQFGVVTVVPLTKAERKKRRVYPFEVALPDLIGNGHTGIAMPHQVRTISKLRILEKVGEVRDPSLRRRLERCLLHHLGLDADLTDT